MYIYIFYLEEKQSFSPVHKQLEIRSWITEGIRIHPYFRPFTGVFSGRSYTNVATPPPRIFKNHPVVLHPDYKQWLEDTTLAELAQNVRRIVCRTDSPDTSLYPHLVSPTGIEQSKPRKIDDCKYLNEWCVPPKFKVEGPLPLTLWDSEVAAVIDDKACFFNIPFHPSSYKYFGTRAFISGVEYYLEALCLIFGWSYSPYINQTLKDAMVLYLRAWTIPTVVFYDDAAIAPRTLHTCPSDICNRRCTVVIYCLTLINCGYYIGFAKSLMHMTSRFKYLGLMVDLSQRTFSVHTDKWTIFTDLLSTILLRESVAFNTLERFTGKCAFFFFVVQGGLSFTRLQYLCISRARMTNARHIPITTALREELSSWFQLLPSSLETHFLSSAHHSIDLTSDASDTQWGVLSTSFLFSFIH